MSVDAVFKPIGNTVLVGVTAVQIQTPGNYPGGGVTVRVRNTNGAAAYLSWAASSAAATALAPAAPTAGPGVPNTIGMAPGAVEYLEIPAGMWFIGSAASFEVTPGQG